MNNARTSGTGQSTFSLCMAATFVLLSLAVAIPVCAQDDAISIDVTAADQIAATYNVSHFNYHIFPASTPAGMTAAAARNFGTGAGGSVTPRVAATIPQVPAPGFYGEDLVYFGGKVLKTVISNNIYVNEGSCGGSVASCWGNPEKFLTDLSNSDFIHLTDQYVGTKANNRYPVGKSFTTSIPLFGSGASNVVGMDDIFAAVHAVAKTVGTGYTHIYHVFLPKGVDTCFDFTNVCYSPDVPSSFVFCAYHGSLDFNDTVPTHVLISVEPYQNVPGCQAAPPNPNGMRADSTNSVLSHEMVESITDPDPAGPGVTGVTAWVSASSLVTLGAEIGDLCEPLGNKSHQFLDPTIKLNGNSYELQGEYSNHYHACAFAP